MVVSHMARANIIMMGYVQLPLKLSTRQDMRPYWVGYARYPRNLKEIVHHFVAAVFVQTSGKSHA